MRAVVYIVIFAACLLAFSAADARLPQVVARKVPAGPVFWFVGATIRQVALMEASEDPIY